MKVPHFTKYACLKPKVSALMTANLLIIEDDPEFIDYLRRGLTYEDYQVQIATSAEMGMTFLHTNQPDLIILDIMLPGIDGITACRIIRQADYHGPILMLTARNAVDDRVTGLDAGADDYLGKPFGFDELLARLRALLRRQEPIRKIFTFADLELDTDLCCAYRHGREITFSRTEYDLLRLFLSHPQQLLTREVILENVWPGVQGDRGDVLDVYVSRLRRKLGSPPLIHTVYGMGYILKEDKP